MLQVRFAFADTESGIFGCNERASDSEEQTMDGREAKWREAMLAERRGDASAYEAFLRDFAGAMRRIVAMQLRRGGMATDEAEDVVQEVLIAVHSKRDQWDCTRPLVPWLNAIARYKTIDALRRLRRRAQGRLPYAEEDWCAEMLSEDPGNDDMLDAERLLSCLSPAQQAAVRAVALEGASHREAAHHLGTSEGAVRVAFHRSVKKLGALVQRKDLL